jgi:hypothetical protein
VREVFPALPEKGRKVESGRKSEAVTRTSTQREVGRSEKKRPKQREREVPKKGMGGRLKK